MEKGFKQRVQKVAIRHFMLSGLIGILLLVFLRGDGFPNASDAAFDPVASHEAQARRETWLIICGVTFGVLQPQFLLHMLLTAYGSATYLVLITPISEGHPAIFASLVLGSFLLWSYCFGWLYAKAVDRLNRFGHATPDPCQPH